MTAAYMNVCIRLPCGCAFCNDRCFPGSLCLVEAGDDEGVLDCRADFLNAFLFVSDRLRILGLLGLASFVWLAEDAFGCPSIKVRRLHVIKGCRRRTCSFHPFGMGYTVYLLTHSERCGAPLALSVTHAFRQAPNQPLLLLLVLLSSHG